MQHHTNCTNDCVYVHLYTYMSYIHICVRIELLSMMQAMISWLTWWWNSKIEHQAAGPRTTSPGAVRIKPSSALVLQQLENALAPIKMAAINQIWNIDERQNITTAASFIIGGRHWAQWWNGLSQQRDLLMMTGNKLLWKSKYFK